MTSIDDLVRRLSQIDKAFDKDTQLQSWSFDKTTNNVFGVAGSTDFSVFLSFGKGWPEDKDKVPGTSAEDYPTVFPNPLQDAFKQVLEAGKDSTGKACFIDMASLDPEAGFFTEKSDEHPVSVATALLDAVDSIDSNVTPIIRIICGHWDQNTGADFKDNGRWWEKFEEMFWDQGKSRLTKNKNAQLWVGYYRPVLDRSVGPLPIWPTITHSK